MNGAHDASGGLLSSRWTTAASAMALLSETRSLAEVVEILRDSARAAVGADGIAVVLRDGDQCHYYAEDAMEPLWEGMRFPQEACVSGWAMLNRKSAAIPDIRLDPRIPQEAYRQTFVKSMLMVPIGATDPVAALGAYWATTGHPDADETAILESLAQAASTALANGMLVEEMTELNRSLEARIEQRTRELEAAHQKLLQTQKLELMGQLTGNVAHDFNNLLSPIMTSLDLILQTNPSEDPTQTHAQMAMESAERARALVQRLLAFARRQPLASTAVDVRSLLKGMEALLSSTVGGRIDLRIMVPPNLPNILADRQQLEIAILNLVVNARDAMPEGGALSISASYPSALHDGDGKSDAFLRLTVSDDGVGMDEATKAKALEPFFTTKSAGAGTGLGLAMVHGVVQQFGGAMDIRSEPRAGTDISLWFPITQNAVAPRPSPKIADIGADLGGIAIIVDDHQLVRRGTAAMLREEGYTVVEVASAQECLARLDEGVQPQILITDHVMPGMTGLDLVRRLTESHAHIPMILISGHDGLDGAPADVVRMTKPFRQHELQAAVARARRQVEARAPTAGVFMHKRAS
ncbi:histidine kinase [Sphingobium chungbukense]|uniref:histidine kinase n=2 Tax=Sphingobium chungbukense TaxID=56193 RepID=A0A0M3ALH5_9SPHN|nr:histidine kinase [Sphingobium chungbukense]